MRGLLPSLLGLLPTALAYYGCVANDCGKAVKDACSSSARLQQCSTFLQTTVTPSPVTTTVSITPSPRTITVVASTITVTNDVPGVTFTTVTGTATFTASLTTFLTETATAIASSTSTSAVTETSTLTQSFTATATTTATQNVQKKHRRSQKPSTTTSPRAANPQTTTSKTTNPATASGLPTWASRCSNSVAFSSACSCAGATQKTVTAGKPSTTTITKTAPAATSTVRVVGTATTVVSTSVPVGVDASFTKTSTISVTVSTTQTNTQATTTTSTSTTVTTTSTTTTTTSTTTTTLVVAPTGNAYCDNMYIDGTATDMSGPAVAVRPFRIEGSTDTIYEGVIKSGPQNITTPSGGTHLCDGTNNNANPAPVVTPTDMIASAGRLCGFGFDGTYASQFQDFFITNIGDSTQTGSKFWGILDNFQYTPTGGCQYGVYPGSSILWAYDAFNANEFLDINPKTFMTSPGQTTTITIIDGMSGNPSAGASLNGQTSDANGNVQFVAPATPGNYRFKATKSGAIRSPALIVTVQ